MESKININLIENIEKLYNIKTIFENHYVNSENKIVVIYEVTPVVITENITETQEKICSIYLEFLKTMNFDFKIYIENDYFKVDKKEIKNDNSYKDNLKKEYLNNLEKLIDKDKVYVKKFYMIVTLNNINEFEELNRHISLLKSIGIEINMLNTKEKIKHIIFKSFNRGNLCIQSV